MKKPTFPILIFLLIANLGYSQSGLMDALNKSIVKIDSAQSIGNFPDDKPFDYYIKDKKIIGLGEATHGTSEFHEYRTTLRITI